MAEETKPGAAQNKLGELYVEFGSKGLNVLAKGLGSISSGFGLATTAAKKAADEITKMSQNAGRNVTGLDKINAVTGISRKQLQTLKAWAAVNNVELTEFVGQIETLQQNLKKLKLGEGDVQGLALLGLDPRTLDENKPLEALDAIRQKVQQLDEVGGAMLLSKLGLSQDLLYAFKQGNSMIDERLLLNDKEIEQARKQQQGWNTLKATWDAAQQKFITNQSWVNKVLEKTINLIDEFALSSNKLSAFVDITTQIGENINVGIYTAIYRTVEFAVKSLMGLADIAKELVTNPAQGAKKILKNVANGVIDFFQGVPITIGEKGLRFKTPEEVKNDVKIRRERIQQRQKNITVSRSTDTQKANVDVPVAQNAPSQKAPQIDTKIPEYIGANIKLTPAQAKELGASSSYDLPPLPNIAQQEMNNNQTKNVTVNITQNVTGKDSQEIANNASDQIQSYFNSLQYSNLPGI